eukprot:1147995-Pelagomonas_calceolata.AAC.18
MASTQMGIQADALQTKLHSIQVRFLQEVLLWIKNIACTDYREQKEQDRMCKQARKFCCCFFFAITSFAVTAVTWQAAPARRSLPYLLIEGLHYTPP